MKLLFQTFRTIYRNFGMVWPPFTAFASFFLMMIIFVFLIGGGLLLSKGSVFRQGVPDLDVLTGIGLGLGLLAIVLVLIMILLFVLLGAFVSGGTYNMVSDTLNADRHYWRSFGKGGIRYLGWGILYMIINGILVLIGQLVIELVLTGGAFLEKTPVAVQIANTLYSFILGYLFAMFYPALVDGKLGFGKALATSFRLAWKTFLITILPTILLILVFVLILFALVGIAYVTHWAVSVLLAIPLMLYMIPFTQVWMTLVYRHLTGISGPADPNRPTPNQPDPNLTGLNPADPNHPSSTQSGQNPSVSNPDDSNPKGPLVD